MLETYFLRQTFPKGVIRGEGCVRSGGLFVWEISIFISRAPCTAVKADSAIFRNVDVS